MHALGAICALARLIKADLLSRERFKLMGQASSFRPKRAHCCFLSRSPHCLHITEDQQRILACVSHSSESARR